MNDLWGGGEKGVKLWCNNLKNLRWWIEREFVEQHRLHSAFAFSTSAAHSSDTEAASPHLEFSAFTQKWVLAGRKAHPWPAQHRLPLGPELLWTGTRKKPLPLLESTLPCCDTGGGSHRARASFRSRWVCSQGHSGSLRSLQVCSAWGRFWVFHDSVSDL